MLPLCIRWWRLWFISLKCTLIGKDGTLNKVSQSLLPLLLMEVGVHKMWTCSPFQLMYLWLWLTKSTVKKEGVYNDDCCVNINLVSVLFLSWWQCLNDSATWWIWCSCQDQILSLNSLGDVETFEFILTTTNSMKISVWQGKWFFIFMKFCNDVVLRHVVGSTFVMIWLVGVHALTPMKSKMTHMCILQSLGALIATSVGDGDTVTNLNVGMSWHIDC